MAGRHLQRRVERTKGTAVRRGHQTWLDRCPIARNRRWSGRNGLACGDVRTLRSRSSPTSRTTRSSPDATSGVKSLRARSALTLTRSIERKCTEGSASTLSNSSTAHCKDNRRQYSCRNLTGSNRRDSRVGRIISVHEYDLKPGINIGQSNAFPGHRSTRPAVATWTRGTSRENVLLHRGDLRAAVWTCDRRVFGCRSRPAKPSRRASRYRRRTAPRCHTGREVDGRSGRTEHPTRAAAIRVARASALIPYGWALRTRAAESLVR